MWNTASPDDVSQVAEENDWSGSQPQVEVTIENLLQRIHDDSYELETQLSELDEQTFSRIIADLRGIFPRNIIELHSSPVLKLLIRFPRFYDSLGSLVEVVSERGEIVAVVPQGIEHLIDFNARCTGMQRAVSPLCHKKKSHKTTLRMRQDRPPAVRAWPSILARIDIVQPTTKSEAEAVERRLLEYLRDTLLFFVKCLRKPCIAEALRDASARADNDNNDNYKKRSPKTNARASTPTPTTRHVLPPPAAAHFDSFHGFGEWSFWISTHACRDLHEIRKKDPKLFAIVCKKFRELSNGQFSDDNFKRFVGFDAGGGVPVYEAKTTRDRRIVYRVDCMTVYKDNAKYDKQMLHVFGIFNHAQLPSGKRIRSIVAPNPEGRDPDKDFEYRRRCLFRKVRGGVTLPELFASTITTASR